MKSIKKEGIKLEEEEEEEMEEEMEEEEEEEEEGTEKSLKRLEAKIDEKVDRIIENIKVGMKVPIKKQPLEEEDNNSKMNQDILTRKARPFVKLSKLMTAFIDDIRIMARGGVPKTLTKAMAEGTDTMGGFLVPEEFAAEVIRYASEEAIVRPRARVLGMARDILTLPKLDQTIDQFGGVSLKWTGEAETKMETSPALGRITLNAKKLTGLTYVSDELLADAAVNVANFLVSLFGEAIAYEEDKQFLTGTGVAKPLGIVPSGTTVTRQTVNRIRYADIMAMFKALPAWAHANAVWITTLAGLEQLLLIRSGVWDGTTVDETKGVPLITATGPISGIAGALPMTIFGKPILLTDKLPAVGTKGDLILGDLGWYYIGDRGGLEVASSIHLRFATDETAIRFVKRVDGQLANAKAFVVLT